jgi:hypothetical protein
VVSGVAGRPAQQAQAGASSDGIAHRMYLVSVWGGRGGGKGKGRERQVASGSREGGRAEGEGRGEGKGKGSVKPRSNLERELLGSDLEGKG